MFNKLWVVAALFFLCSTVGLAESDWQFWFDQTTGKDISEFSTLRVRQSFRFGQDVSRLNVYSVLFGLQHHKESWIEYGYYLRYQLDRFEDQEEEYHEIRPTVDLVLKWGGWGSIRWSNRNRFEYRFRDEESDNFRYRNRTRAVLPWELTPLNLKPYGAVEVFLEPDSNTLFDYTRFRWTGGVQTEPDGFIRRLELKDGRRLTLDVYVMYQQTGKFGSTLNEYIGGLQVGYFF